MDDVSSLFQQSSVNDSDFDKVEYRVFSKESFIIGVHDPEGLSQLRVACLDIVASFTRSYIWQKEPFILTVCEYSHEKNKTTTKGNPHLCGCTRVGDNVEDEWFIVWLLFRISKKFPDVLISVKDSDGEFLLIESAYHIPSWLNPENSINRVFIHNNEMHIIPKRVHPVDSPQPLDLSLALSAVSDPQVQTKANLKAQEAIQRKISGYPEKANENLHNARCRVPVVVAQILKEEPQLVSLAVDAFYNRDVADMQAASMMKSLSSNLETSETVELKVRFNKSQYAQLKLQSIQPPKKGFPFSFGELITPPVDLGMKLTLGFEMCFLRGDSESSSLLDKRKPKYTFEEFCKALEGGGYFRQYKPESPQYNLLKQAALQRFSAVEDLERIWRAIEKPQSRMKEILDMKYSKEDFVGDLDPSDDDSWLQEGAEVEIEEEMKYRESEREEWEKKKEGKGKSRKVDAEEVALSMKSFLEMEGSLEGAELTSAKRKGTSKEGEVKFKVKDFLEALEGSGAGKEAEKWLKEIASQELDQSEEEEDDSDSLGWDEDEEESEGESSSLEEENKKLEELAAKLSGTLNLDTLEKEEAFLEEYSEAMGAELGKSSLIHTFEREEQNVGVKGPEASSSSLDLKPLEVDMNLVKNLVESYSSQDGLPGPASNILGLMGIDLNKSDRESDNKSSKNHPSG